MNERNISNYHFDYTTALTIISNLTATYKKGNKHSPYASIALAHLEAIKEYLEIAKECDAALFMALDIAMSQNGRLQKLQDRIAIDIRDCLAKRGAYNDRYPIKGALEYHLVAWAQDYIAAARETGKTFPTVHPMALFLPVVIESTVYDRRATPSTVGVTVFIHNLSKEVMVRHLMELPASVAHNDCQKLSLQCIFNGGWLPEENIES